MKIQDIFGKHELNANPKWGSFEVTESPKILVEKWKDGELISNPETGQDPKHNSKTNKECAERHAGRHWGYGDKLEKDGTLQTGPMWINRGAFNIVVIGNRIVLEPADVEHRVWGLIGFPLGLINLESEDNKPMFFENHKLPQQIIPHFNNEKVQAIQVNGMDIYEIVEASNKVIREELSDTADLVTIEDVLKRYYSHKFLFTLLPFYKKDECEENFREVNSHVVKKEHEMLHANSSDFNWFLKTISSPKVTEFDANEYSMHPFFKMFSKSSQVDLKPFMAAHLISQYLMDDDLVCSSNKALYDRHKNNNCGPDEVKVIETLDYFYQLYSKEDNFSEPSTQMMQINLAIKGYLKSEGFTLIDKNLFINDLITFVGDNIYADKVNKICTPFGYDMRGSVPGADANKKGLKRAFDFVKINFLGNRLSDENALRKIGVVKKSDDLPRQYTRAIIKKSSDKHKGIDIDNTPIEGMDVGGHIISDMELIRMTTEERDEASKQEGIGDTFDFNSNCRAMSHKHNQRMGVLRLSEYLKIMNKSDEEVREIEKKKKTELFSKTILV